MSEIVVKVSSLSKKRVTIALLASLMLSIAATFLYHQSKKTYYFYGAKIIVPDKYINDNFYEITRIHKTHKDFIDYKQLDYDILARIVKFEIRKKFGIVNVDVVGSDGLITVGAKAVNDSDAKKLSHQASTFLLQYWINHTKGLMEPIVILKQQLEKSLQASQMAMKNNQLILESKKSDKLLHTYALEKKIELARLEGEFLGKLRLVEKTLSEVKIPFIHKKNHLIQVSKPSPLKTLIIFLLTFSLITGFILHTMYLLESKKTR